MSAVDRLAETPPVGIADQPDVDAQLLAVPDSITTEAALDLYRPNPGTLTIERTKLLANDVLVKIGVYSTRQASHRVGIYQSIDRDPTSTLPNILATSPLLTGSRGHNEGVMAGMVADTDLIGVFKGPPRYRGPRRALGIVDDANEMLGLLRAARQKEQVADTDEIFGYGESQAANKEIAVLALAAAYGFKVVDGMVVAPCYLHPAKFWRLDQQIARMGGMAMSTWRALQHTTKEQRHQLLPTISHKDMHHHFAVIPVLGRAEAGACLPHIPLGQAVSWELYGKDDHSHPWHVKAEVESTFSESDARVLPQYGHVDGIMSEETAILRGLKLFELTHRQPVQEEQKPVTA